MGRPYELCLIPLLVAFVAWALYGIAYVTMGGMTLSTCEVCAVYATIEPCLDWRYRSYTGNAKVCFKSWYGVEWQLGCADTPDAAVAQVNATRPLHSRFTCSYAESSLFPGEYYVLAGDFVTPMQRWLLADEIISGVCAAALLVIALTVTLRACD